MFGKQPDIDYVIAQLCSGKTLRSRFKFQVT